MRRNLTLDKRYCGLRSTLERLATIANLRDTELSRLIFKIPDSDVRVGFHSVRLKALVTAGYISPSIQQQLQEIRSDLLSLWVQVYTPSSTNESLWHDQRWAEISNRCSRLLLSPLWHENQPDNSANYLASTLRDSLSQGEN
jgi:hypothetical protein